MYMSYTCCLVFAFFSYGMFLLDIFSMWSGLGCSGGVRQALMGSPSGLHGLGRCGPPLALMGSLGHLYERPLWAL